MEIIRFRPQNQLQPTFLSRLPKPEEKAYFPKIISADESLKTEVLKRAGDNNLVYAIRYGSSVFGDATSTSRVDMILIVEDTKEFHKRNMNIAAKDYGIPRSIVWHNLLNKGFNFYLGNFKTENRQIETKYAVIARRDFIKGCNGTLLEKEQGKIGEFGLYVAGRIQKAALKPFFKSENGEKIIEIEKAINSARIDGIWLSLGLLPTEFSTEELIKIYVSLSYIADLRVEKPGKIQTMIEKNKEDYFAMLTPILEKFTDAGLIQTLREGKWKKIESPTDNEVKKRLSSIKMKTTFTNYFKNILTTGIDKGIKYAWQKIERSRTKTKNLA